MLKEAQMVLTQLSWKRTNNRDFRSYESGLSNPSQHRLHAWKKNLSQRHTSPHVSLSISVYIYFFLKHNLIIFHLNSFGYNKKRMSILFDSKDKTIITQTDWQDSTSWEGDNKFKMKLECVDKAFTTNSNSWEIVT